MEEIIKILRTHYNENDTDEKIIQSIKNINPSSDDKKYFLNFVNTQIKI